MGQVACLLERAAHDGPVVACEGALELDNAQGEMEEYGVVVEACALGEEEPCVLGSEVVILQDNTLVHEAKSGAFRNEGERGYVVAVRRIGQSMDLQAKVEEDLKIHGNPVLEEKTQCGDGVYLEGAAEVLLVDVGGCSPLDHSVGF